jgi:two-component system nitrogen regulation response regulator NtrX
VSATILVVDDEKNIRATLRMVLDNKGYETREAASGEEALQALERVDLVILDVRLPGMSGLDVLHRIRQQPATAKLPVLMISGHASVAEAVDAVQHGATDFLEKPLDRNRVLVSVHNALRTWQLQREVERLRVDAGVRYAMIGESPAMRRLYAELEKLAPTHGRVLITGESGTGKELVARALHRLSPRRDGAFVKVNCAAIPAELIESELFGHERGAFTGAQARKKGLFEVADKGTLFLDEIGDMSLPAQAKVLRALESGEITRVGSEQAVAVDVRVVAATNRDLEAAVGRGEFREDLFYRLNVVPLRTPALRERREDVPALALSFLREFSRTNGLGEKTFDPSVLDALSERAWPGNVRELRNVVERMAILGGDPISLEDLPDDARPGESVSAGARPRSMAIDDDEDALLDTHTAATLGRPLTLREHRDRAEREYIVATLEMCDWNISRSALVLGVERTNLHKKMRAFGIQRE